MSRANSQLSMLSRTHFISFSMRSLFLILDKVSKHNCQGVLTNRGAPQGMMPPYGAMYEQGGFYAHPSVPHGAHSQGPAVSAYPVAGEAMVVTPLSASTPAKSSSIKEHGLMKKLKGFDGIVVSLGNGDANGGSGDMSQSGDYKTDGSSDRSDGNTARKQQPRRKRSCEDMTSTFPVYPRLL